MTDNETKHGSMPAADEPTTTVVTGGTGGIGRAVAVALAALGHRVIIVGRSTTRAEAVLSQLETLAPGRGHEFVAADLSSVAETAAATDRIAATVRRLDSLVLCAGVLSVVTETTEEGLERTFVLNYLSRYLLIRRLLPDLTQAPSGRVVLVANAGKYRDSLNMDDLQLRGGGRGLQVAGRTQFANDLLAVELAEQVRDTSVEVTCVYPGLVATDVFTNARGVSRAARSVALTLQRLVGSSPTTAAKMPVFLAQDPAAIGTNGGFFGPKGRRRIPPRASRRDRRHELWVRSDKLVRPWLTEITDQAR
ncbi:SDR family NAD(P)-dependent oxidoreductase [Kribbella sp. NPDC049174]|uniref:SDR family NAD(P)-dependent oxidoreductase n=1 Tax=Kribbella sp. NPDC049174 TaxID=3364112 RepID=UPI00372132CB